MMERKLIWRKYRKVYAITLGVIHLLADGAVRISSMKISVLPAKNFVAQFISVRDADNVQCKFAKIVQQYSIQRAMPFVMFVVVYIAGTAKML